MRKGLYLSLQNKKVWLFSTCRADLSTILPLCKALAKLNYSQITLALCGKHDELALKDLDKIKIDGIEVLIGPILPSNENEIHAEDLSQFLIWISQVLEENVLSVVVGDRFEILILATWIISRNNKVIHLSGGDTTPKSLDNKYRYAISELADLHLVIHPDHKTNLLKEGIDSSKIRVVGDPALQYLNELDITDDNLLKLKKKLNHNFTNFGLFCLHPTSNSTQKIILELQTCFKILDSYGEIVFVTKPNQDHGSDLILKYLTERAKLDKNFIMIDLSSQEEYYTLLKYADFIIGNTSSGIWEAPSYGTPFLSIGDRQKGRLIGDNVIEIGMNYQIGVSAVIDIKNGKFKKLRSNPINPYYLPDSANLAATIIKEFQ